MSDKDYSIEFNKKIPKKVKHLLKELDTAGYEGYIVGGCVRDMYLGIAPNDWDITTNATPEQVIDLFSNKYKVLEVGKQFGTVVIICDNEQFEITTYRIDGNYSDNRRPNSVKYTTNLLEDLERRDFTMNAMVYRPEKGVGLVDPYNGTESIDNKVVHCVGNPNTRFAEDGLRIMRALRFAAQLDFNIEKNTSDAIHKKKYLLDDISKKRIQSELCKILMSNKCGNNILRQYDDVICQIIPEIRPMIGFEQNNPYHYYDVWEHTLRCMDYVINKHKSIDIIVRLSILLHDIGKPCSYTELDSIGHFYGHANVSSEIAYNILTDLKFSNDIVNKVTQLIMYHDIELHPKKTSLKRILNKIGEEQLRRLFVLRKCDIYGHKSFRKDERIEKINMCEELLDEIISENECFKLSDVAVNGDDLIELGIKEGVQIGVILKDILQKIINDDLKNDKSVLIGYITNNYM